jgi:hypothetical protein
MPWDGKELWHANMPNVRIAPHDFMIVMSSVQPDPKHQIAASKKVLS